MFLNSNVDVNTLKLKLIPHFRPICISYLKFDRHFGESQINTLCQCFPVKRKVLY